MDLEHLLKVGESMKTGGDDDQELSDLDTIRDRGFVYLAANEPFSGPFCTQQAQTLLAGQEAFARGLPKSAGFGIVAVEARGKAKGSFAYASALVTKEALTLDSMVVKQDLRHLYPEDVQKRVMQIPSAYYVEHTKGVKNTHWRFVHGPDNARIGDTGIVPVAIVALTPVQITFIPHSEAEVAAWEGLTFGGGHDKTRKHARATTSMSREFSKKLNAGTPVFTLSTTMLPGSRFITHRGMPIYLSHAKDHHPDEPFVVKTVAVEVRDDQAAKTRPNQWRKALAARGWKIGTFGENTCHKLAGPRSMEGHALIWPAMDHETMVGTEEVRALIISSKGKLPAKKTEEGKKKPPALPPKKTEEEKPDPAAPLYAEHDALKARIAAIPPAAWDAAFSAKAKAHRARLEEDSASAEGKKRIKKYRTSLKTLASKVDQAETDAKETLPGVLEKLRECADILKELDIPQDAAKLLKSYTSGLKELADLQSSYIMRSAKRLAAFVAKCRKLRDSAEKRAEKRKVREPFAVPVVDEGALKPTVCRGLKAVSDVYNRWAARGGAFGNMSTALKFDHPGVGVLFGHYERLLEEMWDYNAECEFTPDSEVAYDSSKLEAYGAALQCVFDAIGSGRPIGSTTKKKKKQQDAAGARIVCDLCSYRRAEFNGCGCCKQCFKENHIPRKMDELEVRSLRLRKLAARETEENGPYLKALGAWAGGTETVDGTITDGLHERLVKGTTRFVRNSKANNWDALEGLFKEADLLLPPLNDPLNDSYSPPPGSESSSSFDMNDFVVSDDECEEEEEEDLGPMPMDLEEEGGGGDRGLSHEVVMALKKYRFAKTHERLIRMYPGDADGVRAELDRLSDITEAYAIDMKLGDEEWAYEWYFMDRDAALSKVKELKLDGLSLTLRKVDISGA